MDMFVALVVVMVSPVNTYPQTHCDTDIHYAWILYVNYT